MRESIARIWREALVVALRLGPALVGLTALCGGWTDRLVVSWGGAREGAELAAQAAGQGVDHHLDTFLQWMAGLPLAADRQSGIGQLRIQHRFGVGPARIGALPQHQRIAGQFLVDANAGRGVMQ